MYRNALLKELNSLKDAYPRQSPVRNLGDFMTRLAAIFTKWPWLAAEDVEHELQYLRCSE